MWKASKKKENTFFRIDAAKASTKRKWLITHREIETLAASPVIIPIRVSTSSVHKRRKRQQLEYITVLTELLISENLCTHRCCVECLHGKKASKPDKMHYWWVIFLFTFYSIHKVFSVFIFEWFFLFLHFHLDTGIGYRSLRMSMTE